MSYDLEKRLNFNTNHGLFRYCIPNVLTFKLIQKKLNEKINLDDSSN